MYPPVITPLPVLKLVAKIELAPGSVTPVILPPVITTFGLLKLSTYPVVAYTLFTGITCPVATLTPIAPPVIQALALLKLVPTRRVNAPPVAAMCVILYTLPPVIRALLVLILSKYVVPFTYSPLPMPAPPVTTNAPVVVLVLGVLLAATRLPCTVSMLVVTSTF